MPRIIEKERILYRAQTHWAILLFPLLTIVIGLWVANSGLVRWLQTGWLSTSSLSEFLLVTAGRYSGNLDQVNLILGVAIMVIGVAILLVRMVRLFMVNVVLTSRRLIVQPAAIKSHAVTLPLYTVDRMEVKKSLLGRLLNYGRVRIVRPNKVAYHLHWLASPGKFNASLTKALDGMPPGVFNNPSPG